MDNTCHTPDLVQGFSENIENENGKCETETATLPKSRKIAEYFCNRF